jgi:hypothetical protein
MINQVALVRVALEVVFVVCALVQAGVSPLGEGFAGDGAGLEVTVIFKLTL